MSSIVTLSTQNQVTLPSEARESLNLKSGQELLVSVQGDHLIMLPRPIDFVKKLRGLHCKLWDDIDTETYLQQEREAWSD